ncbi:uncharacterized protein LOC102802124 [Saccoglossus kowalevskii]|uniref:Uncharacterized protein LOC102802124 n=1 Tax=Saccoglossus kowalevskii TaxID=10224 RepID=A0ABM0LWN1_SACKO|nr:PREDICTED: uncharacterized protein LOC102802124 [Saccoglossus kowalevskii]
MTQAEESENIFGVSHRIITKVIPDNLVLSINGTGDVHNSYEKQYTPSEICYAFKTSTKDQIVSPLDVVKLLESDFNETRTDEVYMSQEDFRFMKIIENGIHKGDDGLYTMPLPFKHDKPKLPDNKIMAENRLQYLRRRFKSDPKYLNDYKVFMQSIISAGDAELVEKQEEEVGHVWYIPHHGVYHLKKPGKIRVVFDCSARYKGTSLNDHLLQGPDQINFLVGVLCRFRKEKIAIMCDIERMFHRFRVAEQDRDFLRFLWWKNDDIDSDPVVYKMRVHLFGAVSSPVCANYGLKRIAKDNQQYGSDVVYFVNRNFYVDDGLQSVESVSKAVKLIQDVHDLCAEGNLRLHKFVSNSRDTMESIPISEQAQSIKDLDLSSSDLPVERALGVEWCGESDSFQFRPAIRNHSPTRRGILSTVASIFDPLGFLAPLVLCGKCILQEMCKKGMEWDEPLPDNLSTKWESWLSEIPKLADLKIRRCYKPECFEDLKKVELHHFSDASLTGYGQCSYLRLVDVHSNIHCSLVLGKARVTPLKPVTVPRLELQAAVTSIKVSNFLNKELDYENIDNFYWTDSKVVLGYIGNDARRFHIYVANHIEN